jgi:hypothetical protein
VCSGNFNKVIAQNNGGEVNKEDQHIWKLKPQGCNRAEQLPSLGLQGEGEGRLLDPRRYGQGCLGGTNQGKSQR